MKKAKAKGKKQKLKDARKLRVSRKHDNDDTVEEQFDTLIPTKKESLGDDIFNMLNDVNNYPLYCYLKQSHVTSFIAFIFSKRVLA